MEKKISGEVAKFVDENYKGVSGLTMSKMIKEKFGIKCEKTTVLNYYREQGYKSGLDGRFKKSQTADWMTPEKLANIQRTQFKKGAEPVNTTFVGDRRLRIDGSIYVKLANNVWREEHRLVYEKAHNCKLGKNDHILHLDGNKQNNNLDNLILISAREQRSICSHSTFTDDKDINKAIVLNTRLKMKLKDLEDGKVNK